jgi:hypothetical protein
MLRRTISKCPHARSLLAMCEDVFKRIDLMRTIDNRQGTALSRPYLPGQTNLAENMRRMFLRQSHPVPHSLIGKLRKDVIMLSAHRQRNYLHTAGQKFLHHGTARRRPLLDCQNHRFGLHAASRMFFQTIVHTIRGRVLIISHTMVSSVSAPPTAMVPVKPCPVSVPINMMPFVICRHANHLAPERTPSSVYGQ